MRILCFLLAQLICLSLIAQTPSLENSITIQADDMSVREILKEITLQTGVDFSFNSKLVDTENRIAFSVENASLKETLDALSDALELSYQLLGSQVVFTQPKVRKPPKKKYITLSGFISDEATGESMIGATIAVKGTPYGTFSNEFGYYALSLPPGSHEIFWSHVGYERGMAKISLSQNQQKNLSLTPKSYDLPAVVIGPPLDDILNKKQLGEMELSPEDLNRLPEFAGEAGLVNGLQSLPGIKTHSDGSAYFYTRGGERDQNIIFIDDAPIYNPSHLFGIYSMFIPDFAKSMTVYKSDMPAMLGDRLSSVISIRTKDGNLNQTKVNGAINPFVYRISFETPLIKKRSSVFMTLRRSNFEWLYRRNNPNLDINFVDLHLKANVKLNDKNRLYWTTIWSSDFLSEGPTGIFWANFASTLRWNHIFSPKLFSNTTIYTGNFGNRLFVNPNYWKSNLGMLSIKSDFTHYASPRFQAKFGMDIQGYFNDPGSASIDSSIAIVPTITSNASRKSVLYYQGEWKIREKWKFHAGLRLINWSNLGPKSYFTFDENFAVQDTVNAGIGVYHSYLNLDPRLSLQYRLSQNSQLKISYGKYHQYLQMVSNSVSPFTSLEVWLPASPNILPQVSRQWALSYLTYFEESKMEISAALFHKHSWNQIDYESQAVTYLNPLIEGELRIGRLRSYGAEFLIKKDFGRLHGWMSYTYSRAIRQTETINEGNIYPAFQDRPHDFSLLLYYQWTERLQFSTYWTSYSGSPFSSPTSFANFNDQSIPIYGERHNDRLPAYHRMDISFQYRLNKRADRRFQHHLTFSLNNALAHKNVFALRFNRIPGLNRAPLVPSNVLSQEQLRTSEVYSARFLPSISYTFSR